MKVCFVVESLGISGGVYVILQHAHLMSRRGVDVTIASRITVDSVAGWHPALTELRLCSLEAVAFERFDLAVATWWSTAYDLHRVDADKYIYFVQLMDHLAQLPHLQKPAEQTLHCGLDAITVSKTLGEELTRDYGMTALVAHNGIDKDIFSDTGKVVSPRVEGRIRVLVEGPLGSKTKGVAYAIRLARRARVDEIWLLTSSNVSWYPGVDRVFSGLNARDCASVYRSCDVLLKLSSLESCCLPNLEMMHCGGTVIAYDIPGPDEYLVHGYNALLLPVGDAAGVIDALQTLKSNPTLLRTLLAGARATAEGWPTWDQSSSRFQDLCLKLLEKPGPSREGLRAKALSNIDAEQPRIPSRDLLRAVRSLLGKSDSLNEIKILGRALLLEQHTTPVSRATTDRI